MKAKNVVATAVATLGSWWVVGTAEAGQSRTTFDPDVLGAVCRLQKGAFSPPSSECNGCFFCLLPDGTVIACDGDGSCTVTERGAKLEGYGLLGAIGAVSLAVQQVPQGPADLVPLAAPATTPPEGFCRRNTQGQLLVNVYNQGGAEAGASKLRAAFDGVAPIDVDVPPIAAGTGSEIVIAIPNACFDPQTLQCGFTLGADATAAIAESSETNNNAAGLCGPQFQ